MAGDAATYCYFMHLVSADLLAQGVLPLWNPFIFGGMPLLAALQPGVLYPPNLLFMVLPSKVAMNAVVLSNYFLALSGAYLYARAIRVERTGAIVTGITFAFSGFMMAHFEQTTYAAAAAWMPWILFVTEKLYQHAAASGTGADARRSLLWRWTAIGAACIGLQFFAGLPQATWHIVMVSGAYVIFSLLWRGTNDRKWQFRRRFAVACALMAVCGLLLCAIQLLPAVEFQQQGERSSIAYETFAEISMPPRSLLTLVFPFFFGGGTSPLYHVSGWDLWWLHKWVHGYVGITGLLLALVALFAAHELIEAKRMVWFWATVAALAIPLALGDHLPFGINHLLYRIPVYNLFRGSYRHLHEFTFAAAVLAGLGVQALTTAPDWKSRRRALMIASLILGTLVVAVLITYRFRATKLGASGSAPAGGISFTKPEALVPVLFFVLGCLSAWFYARRRTALASAFVVSILVLDLASFGWFTSWRDTRFDSGASAVDPPAVRAIKGRESNLHSFRVISDPIWPHGPIYSATSHGNQAIARGLQSASGYDPMRLPRPAMLAGNLDIQGDIRDQDVFASSHHGLDLLNVKYLLRERSGMFPVNSPLIPYHTLGPGEHLELEAGGATANGLNLVSSLTNSGGIADNSPVMSVKLHTKDGRVIERNVLAGRDTSEWAYDRADVSSTIKHARAEVAESWDAEGFKAHRYIARMTFDRAQIDYIQFDNLRNDAEVVMARVTLSDSETDRALPLYGRRLSPERWRLLGTFDAVELYENLKVMPRAWYVKRLERLPGEDVLKTIQTGRLPDERPFEPAETALLEAEGVADREVKLPPIGDSDGAEVTITRYEPNRIELTARNAQPGFLVLSETYYRGWDALIDGVETPVHRTNYTFRGISVPAGDHRIEFVFRSPSFRMGAVLSAVGVLLVLLLGYVVPPSGGIFRRAKVSSEDSA